VADVLVIDKTAPSQSYITTFHGFIHGSSKITKCNGNNKILNAMQSENAPSKLYIY